MQQVVFSGLTAHRGAICSKLQHRAFSGHPRSPAERNHLCRSSNLYSENEKVIDVSALLAEVRDINEDFVFEDDHEDEPVWEHEARFKGKPMTVDEMQQEPPQLFSDPHATIDDVVSAYSAEQGFREMSAAELAVAVTAGGLIDVVLDVRSPAEFAVGPTVPGAVNIPLDSLSDAVRSGQLDEYIDRHVVVVCASGQRSAQATVRLTKVFNFQHVSNLAGGMAAWQAMKVGTVGKGGSGCGCGGGGCH